MESDDAAACCPTSRVPLMLLPSGEAGLGLSLGLQRSPLACRPVFLKPLGGCWEQGRTEQVPDRGRGRAAKRKISHPSSCAFPAEGGGEQKSGLVSYAVFSEIIWRPSWRRHTSPKPRPPWRAVLPAPSWERVHFPSISLQQQSGDVHRRRHRYFASLKIFWKITT